MLAIEQPGRWRGVLAALCKVGQCRSPFQCSAVEGLEAGRSNDELEVNLSISERIKI
jgi:hypothetical protein